MLMSMVEAKMCKNDSVIFEKVGCGCGGVRVRQIKKLLKIFLSIFSIYC